MLSSILFCFELLFLHLPPLSSRALASWREMGVFSAIAHRQPNSLARADGARDCNVGKAADLLLVFAILEVSDSICLRWFRSHGVKAYTRVCSCHECVMDPDSRGRWMYDYNELQQRRTRKYLSNCGKTAAASSRHIPFSLVGSVRGFSF